MDGNFPHVERLLFLMEQEGVDQSGFARLIERSRSSIHRLIKEKGKPSYDMLISLREHLGVDLNWFVTGIGEEYKGKFKDPATLKKKEEARKVQAEKAKEISDFDLKYQLVKKDLEMCQQKVHFLERIIEEKEKNGG